ncbi:MAG TPA: phosphatidylglycerophosphatase A [Thermoanaerobaculaceae bacterium]|nr:phosphatidylglycerophosphatase A [Thermoanaerobaculaceae bacterium]HRS15282.1 phosphatidylglycerophosphatase A [Thermoanaerobaculaceae bacterium]
MSPAVARLLATCGGLGDRLPAPGTTVGSLVGAALFAAPVLLGRLPALPVAAGGAALLLPLSVWACGAEALRRGAVDPGPVVLDEVAGQWLALSLLAVAGPRPLRAPDVLVSLLLFRLFDVWKPWPIRLLERLPGGWGIVADDLGAGGLAGLVHLALLALWR